jgi:hypothetical protein
MERILKHNKAIVIIIFLITIFFLFQIPKVQINNDIEVFLPDTHPAKVSNEEMKDIFGESDGIVAALKVDRGTILEPENLKYLKELTAGIEKISYVDDVTSLTNADFIEGTPDGMIVDDLVKDLPQNDSDKYAIKEKILSWDMYKNNLYSSDFKSTEILIKLKKGLSNDDKDAAYYQIKNLTDQYKNKGFETYISGSTAINVLMGDNMLQDVKFLIPFIVAVLIIALYLFFNNILAVVLILLTVSISSIWAVGLMAALGISLTLVSTVIPVLLIAVGSAYGIHILSHYYDYISEHPGELTPEDQQKIVYRTVNRLGKAVFLAALTTVAGFGSLASSEIIPIKTFGIFTAIGIAAAFLVALFLIPSLLIIIYAYRHDKLKDKYQAQDHFNKMINKLHEFYAGRRIGIIVTALVIIIFSLMGFSKIVVDTPLIEMFKENTEIRQADDFINQNFSGTNIMKVMVSGQKSGDLNNPAVLAAMDKLEKHLNSKFPEVGKATSISDYIKRMNQVMHYPAVESDSASQDTALSSEQDEIEDSSSSFYQGTAENSSSDDGSIADQSSSFYSDSSSTSAADSGSDSDLDHSSSFYQEDDSSAGEQSNNSGQLELIPGPDREKELSEYDFISLLNSAFIRAENLNLTTDEMLALLKQELNYKAAAYYEIPTDLNKYNAASPQNLKNLISQYLLLYSGNVDDFINDQLEPDKAQILIQLNDPSNLTAAKVREDILNYTAANFPDNYQVEVSGNATMALEANNLIVSSQTRSIVISFIIVFLLVAISFRSLLAGIYGIIPLAFSLIINFGLMGHLGIKLDVGTAMVASIAIGIGVDYTIHFLQTYYTERQEEEDLFIVTKKTLASTGKAIVFNAISVAAGFLVLLFSNFYPLVYLGFLIAVTMFTSSLASLTILPLLLNLFKPKFISK